MSEPAMPEAPRPCPFCGAAVRVTKDPNWIFVRCEACGCEGPDAERHATADAIAAWNTRSAPPVTEGVREEVARIIDPTAFNPMTGHVPLGRQADALTKAERVLALIAASLIQGGGGDFSALPPTRTDPTGPPDESYQARIGCWMDEMFVGGGADVRTRIDRLIEEVFELAQALEYDPARIVAIRDYTYGRPVGVPAQEMGGVMVTLASLACAAGIDMSAEAERELERINRPEIKAKIMAKQASKNALHTPLPTAEAAKQPSPVSVGGSALKSHHPDREEGP